MIYFIQAGTNGPIKIGYTGNNVARRLQELQTGSPQPLRIVATMRGTLYDERRLHQRFHAVRQQGEWFTSTEAIWKYIYERAALEPGIVAPTFTPARQPQQAPHPPRTRWERAKAAAMRRALNPPSIVKDQRLRRSFLLIGTWFLALMAIIEIITPAYYPLVPASDRRMLWMPAILITQITIEYWDDLQRRFVG